MALSAPQCVMCPPVSAARPASLSGQQAAVGASAWVRSLGAGVWLTSVLAARRLGPAELHARASPRLLRSLLGRGIGTCLLPQNQPQILQVPDEDHGLSWPSQSFSFPTQPLSTWIHTAQSRASAFWSQDPITFRKTTGFVWAATLGIYHFRNSLIHLKSIINPAYVNVF